ncbi:MAG: CoA-binding protein, partial [Granulosicoccus sp.]|nr:CoA-binding protein [Granulosicoccus sp.]
MTDDYSRLLRPRSIAVIGGRWAAAVVEQCRLLGFEGTIWPVHPTKDHLGTEPCYRSIDQLPSVPDAAFVAVRNELTIEAVKDLADIGSGGAICFASGFSETAGRDDDAKARQQRLVDAAGSMPIVGPNCYGMINFLDRVALWPDQHGGKPIDRGVAIITQSSNIAINLSMQQRGLPIAYLMTMGNQAQTTLASMAMALLNDERVTALGLHIEGFSSIRAFESLSSFAQARGKRIVVLKTGVTPLSRAALLSHTRSLSGDDAAASAFIERLHMKRVQGLGEFIETLKVVHAALPIKGYRLFSMSCSGGEAALVGDVAEDVGLQFPPLQENQQNALRVVLGAQLQLSNPLDYHTAIWDDREAMMKMVAGMLTGSTALPPVNKRLSDVKLNNETSSDKNACQRAELLADIALLILDFPRKDRCVSDSWMAATDAFIDGSAH